MDRKQQNVRRAAAQAFMESLNQLQDVLGSETASAAPPATGKPLRQPTDLRLEKSAVPPQSDLTEFEQAAADIEAFMQNQSEQA